MKKFWFFDLDGTLADTDWDIREAWKAALLDLGLVCPDFDARFVAGPPLDVMFRQLMPADYTPARAEALRLRFGAHYDSDGFPHTTEYPGVRAAISELRRRGAKVFIATNKRYAGATAMARRFGWETLLDGLYAGDQHRDDAIGVLRKPALLRFALECEGARADESVMIGDTRNDFEAARENGIVSVAVAWGYGTPEERNEADYLIHSADELLTQSF